MVSTSANELVVILCSVHSCCVRLCKRQGCTSTTYSSFRDQLISSQLLLRQVPMNHFRSWTINFINPNKSYQYDIIEISVSVTEDGKRKDKLRRFSRNSSKKISLSKGLQVISISIDLHKCNMILKVIVQNGNAAIIKLFLALMESEELERIRMLENRMRRPSKIGNPPNEQSLKSIKSTDSKKMMPVLHKLIEEPHEDSLPALSNIRLSEEEMKKNRKITDYFPMRPLAMTPVPLSPVIREQATQLQPMNNSISQCTRSPGSPEDNKSNRGSGDETLREEVRVLREKLRQKQDLLNKFRSQIVESTVRLHRVKRNELRLRVSNNKIRLGEYLSDKKGKEQWIDGTEFREVKEKLEGILKEKELLDKSKRQARKGKDGEQSQDWKVSLASQTYFLSREEGHCQQVMKRLEEEKSLHIKEYRLLYQEQHSRYGRLQAGGGGGWSKIRKYQLLGLLGKGGFSQVYKGFDMEQLKEVAIKIHEFHSNWNSTAKDNYVKHALRQNAVHKMLSHPNIVQLFDTVQIDSSSFCTVLEYCQGPDLSYYLKKHKKIPEKQAKLIIKQVMSAIRYLHELPDKVIHYDLKPQNILFHKGRVKITDFGLCKTTKEEVIELTSQGVGTYWYLPPECFVSDQKAMISTKVDIWSIGVIYYEMLFGEKPFGNQMSQMRILNQGIMLKASVVNFPNTQKGLISNESKEFIRDCLCFNVDQRMDIKIAANHRLFDKK